MTRLVLVLGLAAALAAAGRAPAQVRGSPVRAPAAGPAAPGSGFRVLPGRTFGGYGAGPYFPGPPGVGGSGFAPYSVGYGGYGLGFGYPGYGFGYGSYYDSPYLLYGSGGFNGRSDPPALPPPLVGAGGNPALLSTPADRPRLPARLTVDLPAAATVWVNGGRQAGAEAARTLESPPLPAGAPYPFAVKARWAAAGTTYEWERTVTVAAGERGQVAVGLGTPVKD